MVYMVKLVQKIKNCILVIQSCGSVVQEINAYSQKWLEIQRKLYFSSVRYSSLCMKVVSFSFIVHCISLTPPIPSHE